MSRFVAVAALSCVVFACGRPRPMGDGGTIEDDAGIPEVDAGWVRGDDPTNGWQVVAELPTAAGASEKLGVSVASAPDQFGQPLIAALSEDPNGDSNYDDNRVVFTRWNGSARAFLPLATIETVGGGAAQNPNRQISIVRDAMTNRIGIAYIKPQDNTVRLAISDDDGANFSLSTVSDVPRAALMSNPSLAMANGVAHLAWIQGSDLMYRSRMGAGAWVDGSPGSGIVVGGESVSLALDSTGAAGVAFFVNSALNTADLAFWRPGALPLTVASANGLDLTTPDTRRPSVSLTFEGTTPHVAFHLRNVEPSAMTDQTPELFYAKATNPAGSTWNAPVAIPRNGSATTFHRTAWYQAITLDSTGRVNIAANFQGNGAQSNCGGPKLSRATDGMTFTTCSPASSQLQIGGAWISMWPHRPGKQTIVFHYDNRANPNLKPGIVMWREP
jgi:hypothetical protein